MAGNDSSSDDLPSDIEEAANNAVLTLISTKSKKIYYQAYSKFENWCTIKNVKHINEKVLLAYFEEKKKYLKSSSLWSLYSKLRTELYLKKGIDLKNYPSLIAFLKRLSEGYQAKKSNVLTRENISKFLIECDDYTFLLDKTVLIIGITGACRKCELTYLKIEDVMDEKSYFKVCIPNTKTKIIRQFVITEGGIVGINFVEIIRKYLQLRPKNVTHGRFFVRYSKGKCFKQAVGINTIGLLPKKIAEKIGLENSASYTGHCFRRSSTTLLADSGADIMKIKQHGGWKSNSVAEGYVQDSVENKKRICMKIVGAFSNENNISNLVENKENNYSSIIENTSSEDLIETNNTTSFTANVNSMENSAKTSEITEKRKIDGVSFKKCRNCVINLHIN